MFLHCAEAIDCVTNNSVSKVTACWREDGNSFPGGSRVYFSAVTSSLYLKMTSPWNRDLPEKQRVSGYSRNYPHFMEPEGSLPHSR